MPPTPRAPLRPRLTPGMAPAVLVKWLGRPVVAPAPRRRPAWPKGDPPAPERRSMLKIKLKNIHIISTEVLVLESHFLPILHISLDFQFV